MDQQVSQRRAPKIAFVHPDLGIGGAEQLIIQAALGLQNHYKGTRRGAADESDLAVDIFTSHYDENHCFEETRDGRLRVTVYGDWIPRALFGRFISLCATLRMAWVFLRLLARSLSASNREFDVIIVDQVSALNWCFRWISRKLIFYCHFPDLLLCIKREGLFKKLYRGVMDRLEAVSLPCADVILVNSAFTSQVVLQTFPQLDKPLTVLYPSIDVARVAKAREHVEETWRSIGEARPSLVNKRFFVSLNRYERKKNLVLALRALHWLKQNHSDDTGSPALVIAGGFDERVTENAEVYKQLHEIRKELELTAEVLLLRNISDREKWALLAHATAVLYTPANEHFGIVPLEAMAWGVPVVARKSGGPCESILDGQTGFLCEGGDEDPLTTAAFGQAMEKILRWSDEEREKIRGFCEARVRGKFDHETFTQHLSKIIEETLWAHDWKKQI